MQKHTFGSTAFGLLFLVMIVNTSASALSFGLRLTSYDIHVVIPRHADTAQITVHCTAVRSDTASRQSVLLHASSSIDSVGARIKTDRMRLAFRFLEGDTLELRLPSTPGLSAGFELFFTYRLPIRKLSDTLFVLDRGDRWYPLIPDQIAQASVRCDVPQEYTVLSAGDLTSSETWSGMKSFLWKSAQPVFKIPLVVFPSRSYHETSVSSSGVTLRMFDAGGDSASERILSEARRAFTFYTAFMGQYAFERLTFVEIPEFDGMNIASGMVMVGSPFMKAFSRGDYDGLDLAVAEQWIGAGVFARFGAPEYWFMSVSVPHYMRLMYVRATQGEAAYADALNAPLEKYGAFAGSEKDLPLLDVDFLNTKEKGLIVYGKGPFVASLLHRAMGDGAWRELWVDVYQGFRGRILTLDDFRACVIRHDKNGRAGAMLDRMLNEKGMPEYSR